MRPIFVAEDAMIEENEDDDHWSLCVLPMKLSAAKDREIKLQSILQWWVVVNYVY
jgi:hypothetical protein